MGRTAWSQALNPGYYLLLNVAIGGNWPAAPDATTVSGASMLADYVRVFTAR